MFLKWMTKKPTNYKLSLFYHTWHCTQNLLKEQAVKNQWRFHLPLPLWVGWSDGMRNEELFRSLSRPGETFPENASFAVSLLLLKSSPRRCEEKTTASLVIVTMRTSQRGSRELGNVYFASQLALTTSILASSGSCGVGPDAWPINWWLFGISLLNLKKRHVQQIWFGFEFYSIEFSQTLFVG